MDIQLNYAPLMPKDKSVPIGCIGAGFIMADCHLVAYRQAGFNPVAITDLSAERASEAAKRHGIPKVYDSAEALMADSEVQVLDINMKPINFAVKDRIIHAPHLKRRTISVYINAYDIDRAVYICSVSKLLVEGHTGASVASRICSKVKHALSSSDITAGQ